VGKKKKIVAINSLKGKLSFEGVTRIIEKMKGCG
jgi:hypothetical protein